MKLIDISLDVLVAAGASTERDAILETLQGGNHDPRKRGFTLQQAELSLIGAVDPWFGLETHLIYFIDAEGESRFELEEAFLTTTSLPSGLELEVGFFFTEFGRQNPTHPHAWDWLDQPIIHSRVFGEDGIRGAGARLGWLTPLPWYSELHIGVQNASGETMASFLANDELFEERPIGGRPFVEREVRSLEDLVYLLRLDNGFDLNGEISVLAGASVLLGPNPTGPDGSTFVYGADLAATWRPADNERGWPYVRWQSEIVGRRYKADGFDDGMGVQIPSDTLHDIGFYTQVTGGFVPRWSAGLRLEHATGSGVGYDGTSGALVPRSTDPFRTDRWRISPLLTFQPSEFSRLRLQYNFDDTDHLGSDVHSVWLGFEVLIGAHPAHGLQ